MSNRVFEIAEQVEALERGGTGTMNRLLLSGLALSLIALPSFAGSFLIGINFAQEENAINHPVLYLGNGGIRTIRVCLDPKISDIDQREPIVERSIMTWNVMMGENGNLTTDIPRNKVDFETVILHEMGHCLLGIGHPNLGGLVENFLDMHATTSRPGPNGSSILS